MTSTLSIPVSANPNSMDDSSLIKILLIEDNPGDARLVEILLEESDFLNCKVINKQSLTEGIEALDKEEFSIVLLDFTI